MSLAQGRATAAIRNLWRQERGEIAEVVTRVTLAAGGGGNLRTALGGGTARGLLETLEHTVLPYLDWEEAIVHPVIDTLTGVPRASRQLRMQLERVRALIGLVQADWDALGRAPTHRQMVELRAHLRGLGSGLRAYLAQQERVLTPLLAASGV
jgi:hypothetical protein